MDAPSETIGRQARRLLLEAGAILENDHFVYVTGEHGSGWVDKDVVYLRPARIAQLSDWLATAVADLAVDVVCGPATGGLVVSQWLAHRLDRQAVFAEHDPTAAVAAAGSALRPPFVLRRGYDRVVSGRRVLVVDDVVSSGHSLRQTAAAVHAAGGEVAAAAAYVSRGNVDAAGLGVAPFRFLFEERIPAWPAAACELCARGVPVNTRYAHGAEYVAAAGSPPGEQPAPPAGHR